MSVTDHTPAWWEATKAPPSSIGFDKPYFYVPMIFLGLKVLFWCCFCCCKCLSVVAKDVADQPGPEDPSARPTLLNMRSTDPDVYVIPTSDGNDAAPDTSLPPPDYTECGDGGSKGLPPPPGYSEAVKLESANLNSITIGLPDTNVSSQDSHQSAPQTDVATRPGYYPTANL